MEEGCVFKENKCYIRPSFPEDVIPGFSVNAHEDAKCDVGIFF